MLQLKLRNTAVAPFLISQCYNPDVGLIFYRDAVAPFLISQCYNVLI